MIPISLFIQFFFMSSLREVFKKNKTNKVDRDHFNVGKDDTHTNQYQPPCQHMDICQPVPTLTNQKIKSQVRERKQDLFKFPPFTNQYKPMQTHANLCQPLQTLTNIIQPSKGCLPKKNSIWRYIVPTSHYPLTPFKIRDKHRRDIFWALDPPPPLQKQGNLLNFCTYQEMIFKETIFNHLLFTLSKYAKMAYKLQKM